MWSALVKAYGCDADLSLTITVSEAETIENFLISHFGANKSDANIRSAFMKWGHPGTYWIEKMSRCCWGNSCRQCASIVVALNPVEKGYIAGLASTDASASFSRYADDLTWMSDCVHKGRRVLTHYVENNDLEKDRITGQIKVQLKVTLRQVVMALHANCADAEYDKAINRICLILGLVGDKGLIAVTSWALVALLSPAFEFICVVLHEEDVFSKTISEAVETLKEVHNNARNQNRWRDIWLSPHLRMHLQYLNEVFGRWSYSANFDAEIADRLKKPKIKRSFCMRPDGSVLRSEEQYARTADAAIQAVVDICVGGIEKSGFQNLDEFVDKAYEWSASGSAPGTTIFYEVDGKRVRISPTKKAWLEGVPKTGAREWMRATEPRVLSTLVPKFENGKVRALSNTENWEYVLESYLLRGFEDTLQEVEGALMKEGGLSEVAKIKTRMDQLEGRFGWSYDYKSFENNHTFLDMSNVWNKVSATLAARAQDAGRGDVASDTREVGQWLAKAFNNVQLRQMGTDMPYHKTNFGLPTGTRGTAFMNTLLNKVYCTLAETFLRTGMDVNALGWGHMGDDVIAATDDYVTANALTMIMSNMGLMTNDLKTVVWYEGGELLRKWYTAGVGVKGYLNRMLPNVCCGEWDLKAASLPDDKVGAFNTVMTKMLSRGAISNYAIPIMEAVRVGTGSTKRHGKQYALPKGWLYSSTVNGGAGNSLMQWFGRDDQSVWTTNTNGLKLEDVSREMLRQQPGLRSLRYCDDLKRLEIDDPDTRVRLALQEKQASYEKTLPKKVVDIWFSEQLLPTERFGLKRHAQKVDTATMVRLGNRLLGDWLDNGGRVLLQDVDNWTHLATKIKNAHVVPLRLQPNKLAAIKEAIGYRGIKSSTKACEKLIHLLMAQNTNGGSATVKAMVLAYGMETGMSIMMQDVKEDQISHPGGEDAMWAFLDAVRMMVLYWHGPYDAKERYEVYSAGLAACLNKNYGDER